MGIFIKTCILAMACLFYPALGAQEVDWPTIRTEAVATNFFFEPTCITHAGDGSGRLFIAERPGRVWMLKDGKIAPTPFLDLNQRFGASQGYPNDRLVGLAFPPNFARKQYFYAAYTIYNSQSLTISRFHVTLNPDVGGARTEEVVMTIADIPNVYTGSMAFGPDGFLYIGVSDTGNYGYRVYHAQDKTSLFGKMLRIDVEGGGPGYRIPSSNPFVNEAGALPEIWALGLAAPLLFSFDRLNGDLYIGDIGDNHQVGPSLHEVNYEPAGSSGGINYGWPTMLGPDYNNGAYGTNQAGMTTPIFWQTYYSGSMIPGHVYRGHQPSRLNGLYIYGSYFGINAAKNFNGAWKTPFLSLDSPRMFAVRAFGEDEEGRLFVAGGGMFSTLFEIRDSGQAFAPYVSAPASAISVSTEFLVADGVQVDCLTPGVEIHYTLNGEDPKITDAILSRGETLNIINAPRMNGLYATNAVVMKLRAFRPDLAPSDVGYQEFLFQTAKVDITPDYGNVWSNAVISLSSQTPQARIYYRSTRDNITSAEALYTAPLQLSVLDQVEAYATAPGFERSNDVAWTLYARRTEAPLFDQGPGITNGTRLTIASDTPGAHIHYTIDGTDATESSPLFTGPIEVNVGMTVSAIALLPGYQPSYLSSATFEPKRAQPPNFVFNNIGDEPPRNLSIISASPEATIFYSLDPNAFRESFALYTGNIALTNDLTVRAYAAEPGLNDSEMAYTSFAYPRAPAPWFIPWASPLTNGTEIAIESVNRPGSVIRYTTNGSQPTASSPIYTGPIQFVDSMELKAAMFEDGFITGPAQTASQHFGLLLRESTVVTTAAGIADSAGGHVDGPAALARFSRPWGICIDRAGNLYLTDYGNKAIRKISADGMVSTIAAPEIENPNGIAVDDSGNLYVSDWNNCINLYKIVPNGPAQFIARLSCHTPFLSGLAMGPDGRIYAANEPMVLSIAPDGSALSAGGPYEKGQDYYPFLNPTLDAQTNLFAAYGERIWKTRPDGANELYAGFGRFYGDGTRSKSGFNSIRGLASDAAGTLYCTDSSGVRRLKGDLVTTMAGDLYGSGFKDGPGDRATFNYPAGLCVDANGNVFVADTDNNCIRKIAPDTARIGIADEWQRRNFGSVGIDPNDDPDGDGQTNFEEFWAGTNPHDGASALTLSPRTALNDDGVLVFHWPTIIGKRYLLQISQDLSVWHNVGAEILGDGSVATAADTAVPDRNARWFYRVAISGN